MSNNETKKTLSDLQQGPDALTPLTDEQVKHISGGGAAALMAKSCPVGQHWDDHANCCVPDALPTAQTISSM